MAGMGYPAYGINVVNTNGETGDLPLCRLYNSFSSAIGISAFFAEISGDIGMAVQNNTAATSASAIRTLVSGLYEIEGSLTFVGGGGAGVNQVQLYVDKAAAFSGGSYFTPNSTPNAYVVANIYTPNIASVPFTVPLRRILFLQKDSYLSIYATTYSGTGAAFAGGPTDYFSVRCISTENATGIAVQN